MASKQGPNTEITLRRGYRRSQKSFRLVGFDKPVEPFEGLNETRVDEAGVADRRRHCGGPRRGTSDYAASVR
jgi:hypothetical protein